MRKIELIIGADKFPLIKLSENTFIHLLPVTKFQFERFLWSSKNQLIKYQSILEKDDRISPLSVTKRNFEKLFISNITFTEAELYAYWMGGRLPVKDEVLKSQEIIKVLNIKFLMSYTKKHQTKLDKRFADILQSFENIGINSMSILFSKLISGELCTEYKTIKNELFVFSHKEKSFYKLVGNLPENSRVNKIFRTVIENGEH